ncbi:D-xylose 1-dehydrogenase Gfo6 [Halosimplex salinum]|uniref:D-xylose 1-dehydrogenase Gfo6 n=1 Tax=Halosimplex salinum TaxID=1710538 RepID=UPI000F4968F7|nr:D-xylose 1-dehydrogenase Gfo6 [Halosimplex salinum]
MDIEVPSTFDERDWARPVDGGPVRFAVIGLGWFGPDVAIPAIEESDYCVTTTVVSGDREKAERVADEKGVDHALTYDDYADGEAADAYDAVYVVTPNGLHLPHVETAADLGKDVLCEKPLEATAERARKCVEVCEEAGVDLMTAYRMQTTNSIRWVRDLVQDGVIGDPVHTRGAFSYNLIAAGEDMDQWRLNPDLAGGGPLMDLGVYPLNTSRFVLDEDPTAVHASTVEGPSEFDGLEQYCAFTMEFPSGVVAECDTGYQVAGDNYFEVGGTHGRIRVDVPFNVDADRKITIRGSGEETVVEPDEPSEMVEEFDYFATGVLTDMDIAPDGEHGLFDMRLTEAIYESGENGGLVDL